MKTPPLFMVGQNIFSVLKVRKIMERKRNGGGCVCVWITRTKGSWGKFYLWKTNSAPSLPLAPTVWTGSSRSHASLAPTCWFWRTSFGEEWLRPGTGGDWSGSPALCKRRCLAAPHDHMLLGRLGKPVGIRHQVPAKLKPCSDYSPSGWGLCRLRDTLGFVQHTGL